MASSQDIRRSQRNRRVIDYKLLHKVGLSDNKAEEEKSMAMNNKPDCNENENKQNWQRTQLKVAVPKIIWNFKALKILLHKRNLWNEFAEYRSTRIKAMRAKERVSILSKCYEGKIVPQFLRFRIPNNGKFSDKEVNDFQLKLLKKNYSKQNCK